MRRKVCFVLCILTGLHNIYAYYTVSQLSSRPWASVLLLLLLGRFSRVRLCATLQMAAHQAPPSLGFFRQEHWSGLPFPSPMHESEKSKGSHSVMSDSQRPHGLQPTRLLHPWDFPGKSTGVGCQCLLLGISASQDLTTLFYFRRNYIIIALLLFRIMNNIFQQ